MTPDGPATHGPARLWRLVATGPRPSDAPPRPPGLPARVRRRLGRLPERLASWMRAGLVPLPAGRVLLVAGTPAGARHVLAQPAADRAARELSLVVAWWHEPDPGWSGRLGPLAGVTRQWTRLPRRGWGLARVGLRVERPLALKDLGAAALAVLDGSARPVASGGPARPTGPADGVSIDAHLVNPRGRRPESYRNRGRLDLLAPGVRRPPRGERVIARGRIDGRTPDPALLARVRELGLVSHPPEIDPRGADLRAADPHARATLLVQLAAAGAAVHAPGLPAAVADLIAPELRELMAAEPPTDPLEVEIHSVGQRRAALRHHAGLTPPPVTAIVVCHRLDHLDAIIDAVAGQTYPKLELVLGLHGVELPTGTRARLDAGGRAVQVVAVPGSISFGEAMGVATAHAQGSLVTKLDDDDTYGPEHIWDLVLARHYSGATLVGKGAEFVHLQARAMTVRRSSGRAESAAGVVAGGTMLLAKADLEAVGGWRPVPRSVDRGLLDRVHRAGGLTYRTHPLGYVYHRRPHGHTWAADDEYFLRTATARWPGLPPYREFGAPARGAPV